MNRIKRIVISAVLLLALDFIFISANKQAFETQVINIQRVILQVKPWSAVVCYLFLIFALNYFILEKHRSISESVMLGLVIYGVYESTSYALFKKWSLKLAIMDTLWGGALFGITTALVYQF
jgi:uncharacterized membrane protein